MKNDKYDGYIRGLYNYVADNQEYVKRIFTNYFNCLSNDIKIAFRRDDLELMVSVKINTNFVILFTVNRLNEYRYNYDDNSFLEKILNEHKLYTVYKKISKIKNNM